MTKSELIQRLSQRFPHLLQKDIEKLVTTILDEMTNSLVSGRRIELRGFGAFSVRKREPRRARNPKNGQEVNIGSRFAIYFRTGKLLRDRVNKAPISS